MRIRPTVRLLVVNQHQRVLLFKIEDTVALTPERPDLTIYWVTPGGGVEPDETFEQAGRRELWEETGLRTGALGPWVWSRERILHFPDERVQFRERYYVVYVAMADVVLTNLLPQEQQVYRAHRW